MKPPKWTKADDNRAAVMGWRLSHEDGFQKTDAFMRIRRVGDRFKSDVEAIKWVVDVVEMKPECVHLLFKYEGEVCRKALFLCARG